MTVKISHMIVKQNDTTCVYENIIDDNNDDGDKNNYLGCVPIPNDTTVHLNLIFHRKKRPIPIFVFFVK